MLIAVAAPGCGPKPTSSAVLTSLLLKPQEPIKTRHYLLMNIRSGEPFGASFRVLFGPDPGKNDEAEGWLVEDGKRPRFHIKGCYQVAGGMMPAGETEVVEATGQGTTLIIHHDKATGIDRVFLLKKLCLLGKDRAEVHLIANSAIRKTLAADSDQYVETNAGGTDLLGPFPVASAPQPIKDFVAAVKTNARKAGFKFAHDKAD